MKAKLNAIDNLLKFLHGSEAGRVLQKHEAQESPSEEAQEHSEGDGMSSEMQEALSLLTQEQ